MIIIIILREGDGDDAEGALRGPEAGAGASHRGGDRASHDIYIFIDLYM